MNVNIKSAFDKNHSKTTTSVELNTARLLIEGTSQEERNILRDAGLDHSLNKKDAILGLQIQRTKFEEEYNIKFFTPEEIKKFCIKYKLKFLYSKLFKGTVDDETGTKLLEFFKSRKIDAISSEANNNLFIMAPAKAFNLNNKENFKCSIKPALFYRVRTAEAKGGEMYALIYDKGSKFSILRQLLGIWHETPTSFSLINFILIFSSITTIASLVYPDIFSIGPFLIIGIITLGLWLLTKLIFNADSSSKRMRDRIISTTNWNVRNAIFDDNQYADNSNNNRN